MTAGSLQRFRTAAVGSMAKLFPGTISIAGKRYTNVAVQLNPVMLAIEGGGTIEHRTLTVAVLKTVLRDEPPIGAIVVHDEREYTVNSVTGRGASDVHWRLICIEKDHK